MRHQVSGKKLNRTSNQRKMLFRTQVRQLISNGFLKTTIAKAGVIKVIAEKLINKAKKPSLTLTRNLITELGDKALVAKILEIAQNAKTNSGYIKSTRLGKRLGDNVMIVRLEIIPKENPKEEKTEKKDIKKTKKTDDKKTK